jgi:hypothetical protein
VASEQEGSSLASSEAGSDDEDDEDTDSDASADDEEADILDEEPELAEAVRRALLGEFGANGCQWRVPPPTILHAL